MRRLAKIIEGREAAFLSAPEATPAIRERMARAGVGCVRLYYWVFDDCEDPVDEGREEAEALFTMDKGEDGTYDLLFVDVFVPGTYTGTCTVEGDELHCNIPPNTHDIYSRAD